MKKISSEPLQGIEAIIRIEPGELQAHTPPLTDYKRASENWSEAEYRCFSAAAVGALVGFWTGEPGEVSFDAWPYTEVCSILSGRVALRDGLRRTVTFGAGEGFIVPQGWCGTWLTLEPASKIFVALT